VIITIIVVFAILIFPIFISLDGAFILSDKKIHYKIKIFKIFNLFYGYVEKDAGGIIIHISKRKAIYIPYSSMFDMSKKFKPLRDYHLIKFNSLLEVGGEKVFYSLCFSFVYNYIDNIISWFFYHKKPYFKFDNRVLLYENEQKFNYFLQATVVFNILMVVISFIKILVEKIIYAISIKTRQN